MDSRVPQRSPRGLLGFFLGPQAIPMPSKGFLVIHRSPKSFREFLGVIWVLRRFSGVLRGSSGGLEEFLEDLRDP